MCLLILYTLTKAILGHSLFLFQQVSQLIIECTKSALWEYGHTQQISVLLSMKELKPIFCLQ